MKFKNDEYGFKYLKLNEEIKDTEAKIKNTFIVHAELNAILNAPRSVAGCDLYVSLFPCNECAKAIIQAGIKRVIYEDNKYEKTEPTIASKRMLESAGIILEKLPYTVNVSIDVSAS